VGRTGRGEVSERRLAYASAVPEVERRDEHERQGQAETPGEPGGPTRQLTAQLQPHSETRDNASIDGISDRRLGRNLTRSRLLGHGRSPIRSGPSWPTRARNLSSNRPRGPTRSTPTPPVTRVRTTSLRATPLSTTTRSRSLLATEATGSVDTN